VQHRSFGSCITSCRRKSEPLPEAHINSSARILRILVCGWNDYVLIRVPGLFASRETFVPSHFAAATSGFGSGLAHTKSSTGDFHAETSRVERSALRGVVGVNQGVN
jgi:hypothetical protein